MIKIKEINCKTALSRSGIYGIDYSINPYVGCQHNCAYCFVRDMPFTKDWGKFIGVKININNVLKKEIEKIKRGTVLISSVTDPYQPIEKEYQLTRKILETLSTTDLEVFVLTKSKMVIRDVDIFKKINCEIGLTITTIDELVREIFEPGASSIRERIDTLCKIKKSGINTYVMIGPILPFITENSIEELLCEFSKIKVNKILLDKLNIRNENKKTIEQALRKIDEEMINKYKSIEHDYFHKIKNKIKILCKQIGIQCDFCY